MEKDVAFDRSKIYENLTYQPEPPGYKGKLPWTVQQQVAATNGVQYLDRIGKLNEYPSYELPVSPVQGGVMLDIGSGWGRWLVAGARKGYLPVAMDIRLEFCRISRETLQAHDLHGYAVVADLKEPPFLNDVFDLVWSFSVIQHTHKTRMISCLKHIHRILKPGGYTKLEFPNKYGVHNYFGPARKFAPVADDYQSWEVRYYTPAEYRRFFMDIFGNVKFSVHSLFGIGVLKEDLRYVSLKNKLLCAASLAGTAIAKVISPLKNICDSLYLEADKKSGNPSRESEAVSLFLEAHRKNPSDNLNIIHILCCPATGEPVTMDPQTGKLVNKSRTWAYPVIGGIPIMIRSEAERIS